MKCIQKTLLALSFATASVVVLPSVLNLNPAQAIPPGIAAELELTAEQQAELDAIQANNRSQINALLTAEQQAALQASEDAGSRRPQALRSLDLSGSQRQQIRSILETSRQAAEAVLTETQLQELEQLMAERHNNRSDRHKGLKLGERLKGNETGFPIIDDLNLSADQSAQIEAIRANTRTQLETVLTETQINTFRTTIANGGSFRDALQGLNLSDDQRTEVRSIFQSTRTAVGDILTDEQKEQLRTALQTRWETGAGRR